MCVCVCVCMYVGWNIEFDITSRRFAEMINSDAVIEGQLSGTRMDVKV